jgi:hypothetical protein
MADLPLRIPHQPIPRTAFGNCCDFRQSAKNTSKIMEDHDIFIKFVNRAEPVITVGDNPHAVRLVPRGATTERAFHCGRFERYPFPHGFC